MALNPKMSLPTVNWTVVKDVLNGGRIAGARREKGDTFDAPESHMTFLELEGVVARTADLATAAPVDAAPAPSKTKG